MGARCLSLYIPSPLCLAGFLTFWKKTGLHFSSLFLSRGRIQDDLMRMRCDKSICRYCSVGLEGLAPAGRCASKIRCRLLQSDLCMYSRYHMPRERGRLGMGNDG
ncbi:hypothetical protein BZA77DRAFT_317860 [Pyronema omphalodes]|nr:hypothetical protein BZA77DRAFT_317860 [Pyronema omphalodes]